MAKAEPLIEQFRGEIVDLTGYLMERSLIDDQNLAVRRDVGNGLIVLEAPYWADAPSMLKTSPYQEMHQSLLESRSFDLRFLDGGLVQFRFEFTADRDCVLRRARAAYLPSPELTPYQHDPEIYLHDEVFGHVVDVRAVTVPIRFDFDSRQEVAEELHHPYSHVTLGQYPHCRIAAVGAVTPFLFTEMVLRGFYRTKSWLGTTELPPPRATTSRTIVPAEESLLHFAFPTT